MTKTMKLLRYPMILCCALAACAGATLKFTAQQYAFVATLETSMNATGPWRPLYTMQDACPMRFSFTVWPGTNESEFFRIRPHDNGIVQTPYDVRAVASSNSITVTCPLLFRCDDMRVSGVRVWRSYDESEYTLIGTSCPPWFTFTDTNVTTGTYSYKMQAFDQGRVSWLSEAAPYIEFHN